MDTKKLERAEQQLQKKQDKRDGGSSAGGSAVYYKGSGSEGEATASQAISRRDENACEGGTITKDIRIENFDISFGDKVRWEFLIMTGKSRVPNPRFYFHRRPGLSGHARESFSTSRVQLDVFHRLPK